MWPAGWDCIIGSRHGGHLERWHIFQAGDEEISTTLMGGVTRGNASK